MTIHTGEATTMFFPTTTYLRPTTVTTLTYQDALGALEKAVVDRGEEYVYPRQETGVAGGSSCLYWHKNEQAPGCLVGLALHQLGVSGEALEAFGPANIGAIAGSSGLLRAAGVAMSPDALRLMAVTQHNQDAGMPWGDALRQADMAVRAMLRAEEVQAEAIKAVPLSIEAKAVFEYVMPKQEVAKLWQLTNA